jgi:hypothetical protein
MKVFRQFQAEVRRINLPRTWVNMRDKKALDDLQVDFAYSALDVYA